MDKVLFSSKSDCWSTPQDLFDLLDSIFHFDLDVCALPSNAKCKRFFSPADDGLSQCWSGRVWCNPPYGRGLYRWVEKAYLSRCLCVLLLPSRTDTRWFQDIVLPHASYIWFLKGRLRFGGVSTPAPFPSVVVVFDPDCIYAESKKI